MKLNLPKEPVDRFEIRWWRVDPNFRIHAHRAVYHVNTAWKELFPDETGRGLPLVDQWQVFHNERFVGRNEGWGCAWLLDEECASEQEAHAKIVRLAKESIVKLEGRIVELRAVVSENEQANDALKASP